VGRAPATQRIAGFATSTTWNSISSRSGVASTRTSLTEQFDSGVFRCSTTHVCPCKRRPLWAQTVTDLFVYELPRRLFHIGNFSFWVPFLKQLLLRNCAVDFVEICNFYVGKMIIKAAKRIFNSDEIWCSYSDLNFGVTFFGTQCISLCQAAFLNNLKCHWSKKRCSTLYREVKCWSFTHLLSFMSFTILVFVRSKQHSSQTIRHHLVTAIALFQRLDHRLCNDQYSCICIVNI